MHAIVSLFTTYLPYFVLVLTLLVFVHEFGHYWVGRRFGIHAEVFSIGFGPELFGWTDRNGTRWKVSAIPLGGFVKFLGDNDASSATPSGSRYRRQQRQAFSPSRLCTCRRFVLGDRRRTFVALLLLTAVLMWQGALFAGDRRGTDGRPAAQAGLRRAISLSG